MQSNKTVFRVYSYGGQYDDAWEKTEGICETLEVAEKLTKEVFSYYDIKNCTITRDQYFEMIDKLYKYEFEYVDDELPDDTVEALLYLFPDKYSKEEIERAEILYDCSDFIGVDIEEVKFYAINS